jgi:hypothetical protein
MANKSHFSRWRLTLRQRDYFLIGALIAAPLIYEFVDGYSNGHSLRAGIVAVGWGVVSLIIWLFLSAPGPKDEDL